MIWHARIEEAAHTYTHVLEHTKTTKHIPAQTQPKASPSHCCPSSETLKPGWQMIQVNEPSLFVHVPWGHVVGSAHSSISAVKQYTLLDILCRTGMSKQPRGKDPNSQRKAKKQNTFSTSVSSMKLNYRHMWRYAVSEECYVINSPSQSSPSYDTLYPVGQFSQV